MKHASVVVLMCLVAGCAQAPETQKPAAAPPRPQAVAPAPAPSQRQAPAPAAPAPSAAAPSASPAASATVGQEAESVTGAVTKVDKEAGLLELQTPSGWSQFIVTDPERKKDLVRLVAGEKVDVTVRVQGGERKVVAVIRRNPPVPQQGGAK